MLTRRQQQVLEFIRNYMAEHQQAPTESEIATGIGISSRGVAHRYVVAIEKAGYIKTIPGKRRNIRLRHNYKNQVLGLPLLGGLAKDSPIKALQHIDIIDVDTQLLKPNRFLLQVTDHNLQKCGIFNGDFIVCERHNIAKDGEIVIAIIAEKTARLATFHGHEDGTIGLSDPYLKTNLHVFSGADVKVHATYKALIRMSES